jgi:predicted acyltransferase
LKARRYWSLTLMSRPAAPRLLSLDAFRGATIAGMLLVNNPGSWSHIYAPLEHAPWHGWTPTDTIFPSFLWIMGVAMTLSFARRVEAGGDRGELFRHVMRRSAIIFGLGVLLVAFPFGLLPTHHFSFARMRIPGVLARIAVCYLCAGAICLWAGRRGQIAWVVGLLTGYALLLKFVPVPGYGAGHIDEAVGNLAWWIDSHVLAGHTWSGAPAPGFDPEGIISTLPAIATTVLGALAGQILRAPISGEARTARLFGSGVVLLVAGALLNLWLPINKNLWTSSFTLFMAGWASVFLAAFYWLIDVRGWRRWATPFVIYGMNAIVIFVLAGLIAKSMGLIAWQSADGKTVTLKGWIYAAAFTPYASPINASLAFALAFVAVFFAISWALWRKRWFLKI